MGNDNKVAGHLDAHHVALCMQGPGMIQLSTTQQEVAPGEAKPDHTISVVKDTENSKDVRVMNVHSGTMRGEVAGGGSREGWMEIRQLLCSDQ